MKNEWINVDKALPKILEDVLLFLDGYEISTGYLSKRRPKVQWRIHNSEAENQTVLFWMRLPKYPFCITTVANLPPMVLQSLRII